MKQTEKSEVLWCERSGMDRIVPIYFKSVISTTYILMHSEIDF